MSEDTPNTREVLWSNKYDERINALAKQFTKNGLSASKSMYDKMFNDDGEYRGNKPRPIKAKSAKTFESQAFTFIAFTCKQFGFTLTEEAEKSITDGIHEVSKNMKDGVDGFISFNGKAFVWSNGEQRVNLVAYVNDVKTYFANTTGFNLLDALGLS